MQRILDASAAQNISTEELSLEQKEKLAELKLLWSKKMESRGTASLALVEGFVQGLYKTYAESELRNCELFHLITGSQSPATQFDLPKREIENFIRYEL